MEASSVVIRDVAPPPRFPLLAWAAPLLHFLLRLPALVLF
jgi:hypothetical protein